MYLRLSTIALLSTLFIVSNASAYPSAVVFSPTGDVKPLGTVGVLAYTSTNLAPSITAGATWLGVEGGVLPSIKYGESGTSFGGLEVGFDTISPFGVNRVKPVLNAKAQVFTEYGLLPHISVGIMDVSPAMSSMNFTYMAATKTLLFGDTSYGRITLGYGNALGSHATFQGTFPFKGSRSALMAGYESPLLLKHIGCVLDYLGGTSEISSVYMGATLTPIDNVTLAAGAFLANDRSTGSNDGFFGYVTVSFDVTHLGGNP